MEKTRNVEMTRGNQKSMLKTNLHAYYKDTLYKHIKSDLKIEKYLSVLPNKLRVQLCKFRLSNHKLPIEKGRTTGIPRDE